MKHIALVVITMLTVAFAAAAAAPTPGGRLPKREFRGAWLHTVYQEGYLRRTTAQNQAFIRNQLDSLRLAGINAVLFQVRPQADAFYASAYEPWSRYLTDDGKAPSPLWDPLAFIIAEAHARGMELHAWLNPYRVTASKRQVVAPQHKYYHSHKDRFVRYGGKIYFDPGIPENRDFIVDVVADIIDHYDVDGIHFDDYFYPYPERGLAFADDTSYSRYGGDTDRDDWRRGNVDKLIEAIHTLISQRKPWVRFGISPFGIWRNHTSDPRGSDTAGLENYDALYADVLLWAERRWVDYLIPQLYWKLDHRVAPYRVLAPWWDSNSCGCQIYIGQDIACTMREDELAVKLQMTRAAEAIKGNCWWPGYDISANRGGIADSLATTHQATIALPPTYPHISSAAPRHSPKTRLHSDGVTISWSVPKPQGKVSDEVRFVVYRFSADSAIDIDDPANIIAVTDADHYTATAPGIYAVTALDRVNNESHPSKPITIKP